MLGTGGPLTVNAGDPVNAGRLAWWLSLARSGGGGRAIDLFGQYHGRLVSGTSWKGNTRLGALGPALSFDGSNDYVDITASYANLTDFTLAAWIYPAITQGQAVLFRCGTHAAQFGNATNVLRYYDGTSTYDGTTLATAGAWWHVAWRRQANILSFWINGIQDAGTFTVTASQPAITRLGSYTGGASNQFNGQMDDATVFSRAVDVRRLFLASRESYAGPLYRPSQRWWAVEPASVVTAYPSNLLLLGVG